MLIIAYHVEYIYIVSNNIKVYRAEDDDISAL